MTDDDIREVIEAVLAERFPKLHILSINIHKRADEDGDGEVGVRIVFDNTKKGFDAKKIPAFMSAVVQQLNEAEESRFPIISFIAKSDLGKRKPEAA